MEVSSSQLLAIERRIQLPDQLAKSLVAVEAQERSGYHERSGDVFAQSRMPVEIGSPAVTWPDQEYSEDSRWGIDG